MDDYHARGAEARDYRPRVRLATPEGVEVELELAGVGTRGAATVIDLLLVGALAIGAFAATLGLGDALGGVVTAIVGSALVLVVLVGYDLACELAFDGRTLGKRALGLRVVRADGRRVDLPSSLARNAARLVELPLAYLPAIVMVWLTARQQRFGDLLGGTLVVRQRQAGAMAHDGGSDAALLGVVDDDPRLAARTRTLDVTGLRHEDVSLVRGFLLRAPALPADRRAAVAADLAAGLRARLGAGTEGLGDEDLARVVHAAAARR